MDAYWCIAGSGRMVAHGFQAFTDNLGHDNHVMLSKSIGIGKYLWRRRWAGFVPS